MNYRHLWLENGASTLSMAIKVTCLRFTCRLLPTLCSAIIIYFARSLKVSNQAFLLGQNHQNARTRWSSCGLHAQP